VGANSREDINYIPAGSSGGENFGWNVMEGSLCRQEGAGQPPCGDDSFTGPVLEYPHQGRAAVIGGYLYRGPIEELQGTYIYTDNGTGLIQGFQFDRETQQIVEDSFVDLTKRLVTDAGELRNMAGLGVDSDANLYFTSLFGGVYVLDSVLLPGDINLDDSVDLADFATLKQNFGTTGSEWTLGDLDDDGSVGLADFGIIKEHFGETAQNVPEPASWQLLILSTPLLLLFRLRHARASCS